MSNSTISTFELFQMFPDSDSARIYFEARCWPSGAVCPACGEARRIGTRKGGFYRCNACLLDFTVRTGTIFEKSKVPLNKWIYAMYLLVTARKGISSLQLAKQIGVTQKTAWFMLQRLREACGNDPTHLSGIVEIDEAYIGGKEVVKHESKRKRLGRGDVGNHTMQRLAALFNAAIGRRLAYKDQQDKKIERRVKRQRKEGSQDDRDSSI